MKNKKDILPIAMASIIALVVTGVVRWLIPGGTIIKQQPLKKELSLPDIALTVKNLPQKEQEAQVLCVNSEIKKDQKITTANVGWKNWPIKSVQPHFIAQDMKGSKMNNKEDYDKALKMWAKSDIPVGTPLTTSMLTDQDPEEIKRKKAAAEAAAKKKKEEEERQKELEKTKIRVGYRAVTFSVDQRASVSANMIAPGDLIDVLILENVGNRSVTHSYRDVKLVAIDGVNAIEKKQQSDSGLFGNAMQSLTSTSAPKNVTLEVKRDMVDTMLKQAGKGNGIVISIRNQNEEVAGNAGEEEETSMVEDANQRELERSTADMAKPTAADDLLESRAKERQDQEHLEELVRNLNDVSFANDLKPVEHKSDDNQTDGSRMEIPAGRILPGDNQDKDADNEKPKIETAIVHRKGFESERIGFDEKGNKVSSDDSGSSGGSISGDSGYSSSSSSSSRKSSSRSYK